jgi:hypothetical protein
VPAARVTIFSTLEEWRLLAGPRKPKHLNAVARPIGLPAKLKEMLGGGAAVTAP